MTEENVIIIGSGPAGLAASIYNARAELKPLVIGGSPPGGQLTITTHVENYPGFESIMGPELINKMREQSKKFGTRFIDSNIEKVEFDKSPFTLTLANGSSHSAKAVIIATGASAMWLGIESETRLRGKGVSACATCDGFFFRDKVVAVVGGGDTALEEALFLTKFASKVYIIHRRDEFRASKIMQKRATDNKKIEIIWNAEVDEILGDEKVSGIKLKRSEKAGGGFEPPAELTLDGVFIAIGHKPNTSFLGGSGLLIDQQGYLYTAGRAAWESRREITPQPDIKTFNFDYQYQTNIPGVFAAGDVIDYTYRQATTAVGMGVAAAIEAEKFLGSLE